MKLTKIRQEDKTELQVIRETLGYSRPMFARKILHKAPMTVTFYELKKSPIPESVLVLARIWLDFYKKQNNIQ